MPYLLMHPLPPPHRSRNPSHPSLPTFTTSTRAIAHFFHSHGWRAIHMQNTYRDSLTPAPTTACSPAERHSLHPPTSAQENTSFASSSLASSGSLVELHCYDLPIDAALFQGPDATERQKALLRWFAYPDIEFMNEEGVVDLRRPNVEKVERLREREEHFRAVKRKLRARESRERGTR